MDGRIVEVTQELMRNYYKLNSEYETKTCNIKATTVEIVMHNGLIELKAKFPRSIIEEYIERFSPEEESDE